MLRVHEWCVSVWLVPRFPGSQCRGCVVAVALWDCVCGGFIVAPSDIHLVPHINSPVATLPHPPPAHTLTHSHVHKFILADNRHYTFYMFKDVIKGRGWWLRFALLPAHVVAIAHIANRLGTWQTRAWTTVYCIAVVLVLVPAPLVE